MSFFWNNIAFASWAFGGWYLVGLGPSLLLLPRENKFDAFLLAPLTGLCLLTVVSLFEMTVIMTPIYPWLNFIGLALISLMLCRISYKKSSLLKPQTNLCWLSAVPFALLILFSLLFKHDGFHLLVGSSDPLQYCLNARHILEHMNTGSALDSPVPRHDHFIYEMCTRIQPYLKTQRRGAEAMLATTKALTGLSYQEAFPVTVLTAFMTLALALGFLGRLFFRFTTSFCVLLQFVFLTSFYLFLLHVQGSLAMILGMGAGLISLALLSQVTHAPSWKWITLSVIILGGYFSTYSEPALFNVLIPSVLLVFIELRHSWKKALWAFIHVSVIYCLVFLIAPFAVVSILSVAYGNVLVVGSALLHSFAIHTAATHATHIPLLGPSLDQWSLAAVVLGMLSYYDNSVFNTTYSILFNQNPMPILIGFCVICIAGLIGLLKSKSTLSRLYAIPLFFWFLSSFIVAREQDYLRFARSLHYSLPFLMIGLVCLAYTYPEVKKKILDSSTLWLGRSLLIIFVALNLYTDQRTFHYLVKHGTYTDTIILHFDERAKEWLALRQELQPSLQHNTPVLISGYKETIRPLAIVSALLNQRHVLGSSVLSLWNIYNMHPLEPRWRFNTRLTEKQLEALYQIERNQWPEGKMELNLMRLSEQAVTPIDGGYPIEWEGKDVYAPRIKRFPTIGDVIYRHDYVTELPTASSLQEDKKGPFRIIQNGGPLIIKENSLAEQLLVITYEGKKDDLRIKRGDQFLGDDTEAKNGWRQIAVKIKPDDWKKLTISITTPVKLRGMALDPG